MQANMQGAPAVVSDATTTFRDLEVAPKIADSLEARGITVPFPIQRICLPDGLAGRDVLAQAPTGSGKTLAFAIPIVQAVTADSPTPAAIILVPTRELAVQVTEEFHMLLDDSRVRVVSVYGGTNIATQADKAAKAHVIVATPGRLNDLIQRRMVDVSRVQMLVLDEADRMLDMGFQPQVDRIVFQLPRERHTMFFSATLDGKVGRVARGYTHDPVRHETEIQEEKKQGKITHHFLPANRGTKVGLLIEHARAAQENGLVLVFVRTKRGADELVRDLKREGVDGHAMHGDMAQNERERVLKRFEKGELPMLIATDVAARGLDLDDIGTVINFDAPDEIASYTHRVGRTGRAGRSGTAITFVEDNDQYVMGRVAEQLGLQDQYTEAGLKIMAPRMAYQSKSKNRRLGPPRPGGGRRFGR
jgi:superfamily II DNA/RNA helicase